MPARNGHSPLLFVDNGHANMGNEIFGVSTEDALEDIGRVHKVAPLQQRFAQQAVGSHVAGVLGEDMAAVGNHLQEAVLLKQRFDLFVIAT